jgi:hypothetical protein
MTPQEKAKELVDKFKTYADWNGFDSKRGLLNAKQCALIAVYEILSMGIMADSGDWNMAKEYWQEVKQEIEKL